MAITVTTLPDGRKRVFITSGTTQWPDPGDWNSENNTIEVVAGGGLGSRPATITPGNGIGGAGGGGGGYAVASNVSLTFPVSVVIDALVNEGQTSPTTGTNFGGICYAGRGGDAPLDLSRPGGLAGAAGFPTGYAGGAGGAAEGPGGASGVAGGSGGGAAGPNGSGGNGVIGLINSSVRGVGGSADGGTVPGSSATYGNSGNQWGSYGCGSGGSGGPVGPIMAGGTPGDYGGGGGGGAGYWNNTGSGLPGYGAAGLIIITYMPLAGPEAIVQIIG